VSVDGLTEVEPERATDPTVGVILADVASVVFQVSVALAPKAMFAGLALKVQVGTGGAPTVTNTLLASLPPGPVHESVKDDEETIFEMVSEPEIAFVPVHPLLARQLVASVEFQVRMVALL